MKYLRRFLAAAAFTPALFSILLVSQPSAQAAPAKLRVRASQAAQLKAQGARLLADYGSFQLIEVDDAASAAVIAAGGEPADDSNFIELNARHLDTRTPEVATLRKSRGAFAGKKLHLVQFVGPIKPEWRDALEQTGVRVVDYIPQNAYLVHGSAAALAQLQTWAAAADFVQWEGAYADEDKVHPKARVRDANGNAIIPDTDVFTVQLIEDAEANPATLDLIDRLKLEPVQQQFKSLHYLNVIVRLPAERLAEIAAQPEVISIQPRFPRHKMDERQDQILAGNLTGTSPSGPGYLAWLASKGFTPAQFAASGFVVDVTDSGIDNGSTAPGHFGLYQLGDPNLTTRVAYNRLEGTANAGSTLQGCDGHGNLNTHIIAGFNDRATGFPHQDASGFHYGLGVCPFVKVGSSVIFDTDTFTNPNYPNLASRAYRDGARVSNNSWGADTAGAYDVDAQAYDALVRDSQPTGSAVPVAGNQQLVFVFAAGNAGSATKTVGSPGTAKNVIVVGAAENVHSHSTANGGNSSLGNDGCTTPDSEANSANDIVGFSSRGPCADGRQKPDLVAPGTHITGGVGQSSTSTNGTGSALACFKATGVCALPGGGTVGNANNFFPLNQQFYTTSSGTSHSTPGVAGACALLRQNFINQALTPPSPAMTKAFLVNAARYLNGTGAGDTLPSPNQGMGEVNLGTAFDGVPRLLRDQLSVDKFTATGQTRTINGAVVDSSKPFRVTLAWTDAPGSTTGNAYNNNLDLTVTVGGNTYKGNVFSGGVSIAGGTADAKNNLESVFLPAGVSGNFVVTVSAANINSDGVPNEAPTLDQDFALVIYNAAEGLAPAFSVSPGTGLTSGGQPGGPFSPASLDYTLSNIGATNLDWSVSATAAWLTLSASSGSLAVGASTNVTVTINSVATTFAAGVYSDILGFTNLGGSIGNTTRAVSLSISNPAPLITTNGWNLASESCPNGAVDPGETVTIDVTLKNIGSGDSSNLVATLLATGGVTSPGAAQNYGALAAGGGLATRPFAFTATGTCGGSITATFQLQDGATSLGTVTFTLPLGIVATLIAENFDGVAAPALPVGWTTATSGGQSLWVSSTTQADTAPNSAFASDVATAGVNELVSPAIAVPAGQSQLTFRHFYNTEASSGTPTLGYDGGVLEIKIGAAAFTDILTAGGSFAANGYNRTISGSFSNPLANRQAWSGNSGGFVTTVVDLPAAAAGQTCQLKWRCGSDSSVSGTGWFVDSVSLSGASCCSGPTAPSILTQPQSQSANIGDNVTFSVTASGTAPFSYQWFTNGIPIPGAKTNIYAKLNVTTNDALNYFVIVTNSQGSVTSSVATLTVIIPVPVIVTPPQSQTVFVGSPVNFSVTASGGLPLSYQWRSNGVDLAGATLTNYAIASAQLSHAAGYSVIVTNNYGSATSSIATLTVLSGYSGVLAGWDMNGVSSYGVSPMTPTTNAPNVTVVGLTRGPGVTTTGTAATRAWGGNNFNASSANNAITAGDYVTLGVAANAGYLVSFGSVSKFNYRRSSSGANNGVLQYQVGAGAFTDIATLSYSSSSSSGVALPAIDLSALTALQNVGAGTNVTFRLVNYGATSSTGTWYIYDVGNTTALDFVVSGGVSAVVVTNPPAAAPLLTSLGLAGNQFQFTLTGTLGSNYVVQVSTNLSGSNWISLQTNAAPFSFIESNADAFPQRFYRGVVAP